MYYDRNQAYVQLNYSFVLPFLVMIARGGSDRKLMNMARTIWLITWNTKSLHPFEVFYNHA